MDMISMIGRWRLKYNDDDTETDVILAQLMQAESIIFRELGGLQNPEVAAALEVHITDSVSDALNIVQLTETPLDQPTVFVDGEQCKIATLADLSLGDNGNPGYKPAAALSGKRITIYTDPPLSVRARGSSSKAAPVIVTYHRQLRPMLYFGQYAATYTAGKGGFGMVEKTDLDFVQFTWPDTLPSFGADELSGATVSIQQAGIIKGVHESTYRTDYFIETHPAGTLNKVFIDSSRTRTGEWFDHNWFGFPDSTINELPAIIHRCSDLPEQYHALIVEIAGKIGTGTAMPQQKQKENNGVNR
jgi:hypothetical protein